MTTTNNIPQQKYTVWVDEHLKEGAPTKSPRRSIHECFVSPRLLFTQVTEEIYNQINRVYLEKNPPEILEIQIVGIFAVDNESNSDVEAPVSDDMAKIKQAFYVKAKIQSKETLGLVFNTDHLVHLGDLPINQIEHAIYDEIAKRIKEREYDKYEILAIEKIIVALDNPPERT